MGKYPPGIKLSRLAGEPVRCLVCACGKLRLRLELKRLRVNDGDVLATDFDPAV